MPPPVSAARNDLILVPPWVSAQESGRTVRLIVKERVLLHLGDYAKYAEAVEVPASMTQEGICRAAGIDLRHFSQYVRPLVKDGLVRERLAHVKGSPQRLKTYELTEAGQTSAARLRANVRSERVRVKDAAGIREERISELLSKTPGTSLIDVVRQAMEFGTVDLAALVTTRAPAFLAMMADAPVVERFAGRQRELEALTREADGPRIFVVRGVAGIGKSSLGAKACEALRGRRNVYWHRVQPWDTFSSLLAGAGDFLHALGKPGLRAVLARGDVGRAERVLREDLVGTRSFLVFDDAHQVSTEARPFFRLLKDAVADATDVRALVLSRGTVPFYDRRDVAVRGLVAEMDLAGLDAEALAQIVPAGAHAPELVELGRRIGGHPLFVDLLRAHALRPSPALRDIHRFMEEEVYADLSDAERQMMKTAALYEVPVPREALFSDRSVSRDVLRSLEDRSLIRPAGTEAFQAHDTIRSFFLDLLTSSERESLGAFAVDKLRKLAADAGGSGDFVARINYLSNAVRLSPSEGERAALWEELGGAYRSIGDLDATLSAFGEALKAAKHPEDRARLHRKRAQALLFWDRWEEAQGEIDGGLVALGSVVCAERGWLDLCLSELRYAQERVDEVREYGRSALRTFQAYGDAEGQVRALCTLADIEIWTEQGDPRASDEYLSTALDLADRITDAKTLHRLLETAAWVFAWEHGDGERALKHVTAMERNPEIMGDPTMRREVLTQKGTVLLDWVGDFPAADTSLEEAIALARSVRDDSAVTLNEYMLAIAWFFQGRAHEALPVFERTTEERIVQGFLAHAVEGVWRAAECHLWLGDVEGFLRAVARLDDPALATGVESRTVLAQSLRGLRHLVRGETEACEASFRGVLAYVEGRMAPLRDETPEPGSGARQGGAVFPRTLFPHIPHFYFGVALRAMGRDGEGKEHIRHAAELLRAKGHRTRLDLLPEQERRMVEALRRG